MVYHGRSRQARLTDIDDYDLVITTYHTLAREHTSKPLGEAGSPLHGLLWYRVVLDEGKYILLIL